MSSRKNETTTLFAAILLSALVVMLCNTIKYDPIIAVTKTVSFTLYSTIK